MADREDRARSRAHWPVRVTRLSDVGSEGFTSPEERLASMWELVVQAWGMAGRALPDYARSDAPVRIVTLGEQE